MDSSSSSSLQTVNIPSPGRKPAHQAPHRGSPVSAGAPGGSGGDGLRGFHAPPVSLPVINPLTLELGAGTEVSKPESVQCPSRRRSRKEFVYTRWALYYQKYIYRFRLRHSGSMINSTTTSLRALTRLTPHRPPPAW